MHTSPVGEDTVLKLHTGPDGAVWYLNGDGVPASSRADVDDFVGGVLCRSAAGVRVTGCQENVDLIVRLYEACEAGGCGEVQLGSPGLVGHNRHNAYDSERTLYSMRQVEHLAASLGGWHRLTMTDFPSYALAYALNRDDQDAVNLALDAHPVWPYLKFVAHLDRPRAAELVALVLDPRWYVDASAPERTGKLKNYLCLYPRYASYKRNHYKSERFRLVLDAWKTTRKPPETNAPGHFLWRLWKSVLERGGTESAANCRTSQHFVEFLRHVWIDAIYKGPRPAYERPGFCPKFFFKDSVESAAYEAFDREVRAADGVVDAPGVRG